MALIRANRESIDDRFSVLGFTIRTEDPLFEVGLATDPELLKGENRAKRSSRNFFSSRVLGASRRGEAVYLVPPTVVARFVGQPRLYFGLATYSESDRSHPVSVKIPDLGNMYVKLSGLTERGLRRTARTDGANGYGSSNGDALVWGGDELSTTVTSNANGMAGRRTNGNGSAPAAAVTSPHTEPAPYSDGYSDDLWRQGTATAPTSGASNGASNGASSDSTASTASGPTVATPTPAPAPVTSQAFGGYALTPRHSTRKPASARALLVSSYYQPSNWFDALTSQIGFFLSSAMWYLGVLDTTVPPHSAICQVRRPDGTDEGALHGSAFFIGPRLLLTAAHVVDGQSELIIVPGKNGGGVGSGTEPLGRFKVSSSNFRKHPSYGTGGHDFDMGLICVPAANAVQAPNYFDLVEELTQSRPEGVVVCGYAARWYATDAIERFVNETIDPNKQHMMGGYIRSLPSDETFDYDLQTLGGTSGSPVYWIEDGAAPRAHMVGVHVAAHSATTNLGCRITPAKLAWIRSTAAAWGQTLTFSLGAVRSLEDEGSVINAVDDPDSYGISEDEPAIADAVNAQALRARALDTPTSDYPAASRFVPAHRNNYTAGRRSDRVVDRIVIHITAGAPRIDGTISWFQNGNRVNERTGKPIRSSAHYIVGRDGEVVQMVRNADTAHHASAANSRSIGIEHNANKPTRSNPRDLPPTDAQYDASARLVVWLCQQFNIPPDREHIRGHMEISPGDNHDCPSSYWDWDHYMECVRLAAAATAAPVTQSLGVRRVFARAQEIITPFYDPANPMSALTCQNDAFSLAREEWFMGVPNTRIFPHSAICALSMTDTSGNGWGGTGFYIGRNRILTCAHNLSGMASVTVIPGKNSAEEPFGKCTVAPSSWRVAPRYSGSGNWDNDLAVIDNVPIAAPNGQWFEFLNQTPSDQMALVVCGYSGASDAVPELTNAIDGDKQHLHGGRGSQQSGFDVIEYPILTLHGASGSPVYHLAQDGDQLKAKICAVHVTGQPAAQGLNRGCFITPNKIDWIEGRATTFALSQALAATRARRPDASLRPASAASFASRSSASRSLEIPLDPGAGGQSIGSDALAPDEFFGIAQSLGSGDSPEYAVALIPQPDKNACWAASMAMLLSYRRSASFSPETLANDVGRSLASSYGWDLLNSVRDRYGFTTIPQPSNTSLYHTPQQWADWLNQYGPLWVVIVGAPHAVVIGGIRGNLADPASVQVKVFNPWDTRVGFDNDPVAFNPPNYGYVDWLPFTQFASDFGNMAQPDYGNWRVLHLPASAAVAQSLGVNISRWRLARPPAPIRALEDAPMASADMREPIEPTRVAGTRMSVSRGSAGASRWALDQLEGLKSPATLGMTVSSSQTSEVIIELGAWPAIEGQDSPLPLTVCFRSTAQGAVGDVQIRAGTPANLAYGVDVIARIDADADAGNVAVLKVGIDYRFSGLAQGSPAARIELRLLGDGRYERVNRWLNAAAAA